MDLRRLRSGEWIVALSGVALLVSLFLPWYSRDGDERSGFEALAVNDVILGLVAAAAVALILVTATQRVPAVPVAFESVIVVLGFVATILVLVRTAWPSGQREWGLWLGLASAAGITAGGWIGVRDERTIAGLPQPEIESLQAPRP
jgi:hypothetical protein